MVFEAEASTSFSVKGPQTGSDSEAGSDGDYGLGLDDLLPEPESPLPAPYSFATYEVPDGFQLELPESRSRIITRLVGSHPLWGHHLWNTSKVVSNYLLRHPSVVKGRRICELGAGAGLPSIVAGLAGAEQVVVTDYPDEKLVANLAYNLDMNIEKGKGRERAIDSAHVWGRDTDAILGLLKDRRDEKYDVLILSDLVFNHSQHDALIRSVDALLSPNTPTSDSSSATDGSPSTAEPTPPCILVFFTHHRPHLAQADNDFFPRLAASGGGWAYQKVVEEWAGVMFEEDPGDERVRGTVHGWRCWRVADGEELGRRPDALDHKEIYA